MVEVVCVCEGVREGMVEVVCVGGCEGVREGMVEVVCV